MNAKLSDSRLAQLSELRNELGVEVSDELLHLALILFRLCFRKCRQTTQRANTKEQYRHIQLAILFHSRLEQVR